MSEEGWRRRKGSENRAARECVSQASYVNLLPIYRGLAVVLLGSDLRRLSASHCLPTTISQGFCHSCLSHAASPKSESLLTQGVFAWVGQDTRSIRFFLPQLTHKRVNAHNRSKFPAALPPACSVHAKERNRNRQWGGEERHLSQLFAALWSFRCCQPFIISFPSCHFSILRTCVCVCACPCLYVESRVRD